ncbi:glycosyltransferase family 4 protein [Rhodanobacter aciditrophus]|uniref:glycosyltransferase family 4 protein n=1 Tax=Rhodanobacter aciditrophus TaxID=1623218 RepID=UPI003CE6EADF
MKTVLFANTDWYLYNFRRSLAMALQRQGCDVLLISPAGPYGDKLRALGLRWEPLPMARRSLNPLREAALLWHLVRLLRRERPMLVHGFTIKCAVYGSLAARLAGVPARVNAVAGMGYVFTSSEMKARSLRPLVRALLRLALGGRGARLILQNADDVALFRRARLVDAQHIRLIRGSGVNCAQFATATRTMAANDGRMRVLLASRLLWDKGLGEFVAALRQLRREGCAIRALLAGTPDPGNPAAVPEETIRGWVSEGLVTWLGHVEDMAGLLASVDVVVLPSHREGLPRTLVEAAACGLPLITTDVPGCREVVTDGVDGLLVPKGDGEALAHAIRRLREDPELARRLGDAARRKARSQFDEHIVIRQTLAAYAELCDPPAVPAESSPGRPSSASCATVTPLPHAPCGEAHPPATESTDERHRRRDVRSRSHTRQET